MIDIGKLIATAALCIGICSNAVSAQGLIRLTPSDDIAATVENASAGTVIELEAGNYGVLALRAVGGDANAPITLRSKDLKRPATVTGMDLRDVNHLVLDGLLFDYTFDLQDDLTLRPFQVFDSTDLTIENSLFDGDVADRGVAGQGIFPTAFGLSIRASNQINVENNEIRQFFNGIAIDHSADVRIVNNDVHSIRMDGMKFTQIERMLIEDNKIHDFLRAINSGDHADMIQFWTARTKRPSTDITIRNNVLNSGLGWYTQSIFMRNDVVDTGKGGREMFYRNLTIEGNVIINAHSHGITVGETDGLIIRNNTVLHNARSDGAKPNPKLWTPRLNISQASSNVTIEENVVHEIMGYKRQRDWSVAHNLMVQDRDKMQPNYYDTIFTAAKSGDPRDLSSYQYLADGPLAGSGIGAPMLELEAKRSLPNLKRGALAPAIRVIPSPDTPTRISFDITQSAADLGLDVSGTQAKWDFGDGATATGLTVNHDYALPGVFNARLEITLPDGQVLASSAKATSKSPEVIVFDRKNGTISSFATHPSEILDLPLQAGSIQLGGTNPSITIPRNAISTFFGSRAFSLHTRIRSFDGYRGAGTVLHIAKTLIVTVTGRGTIAVEFDTESKATVHLTSPPLPVLSGEWVDLALDYSDTDGTITMRIDGTVVASAKTNGPTRPMEYFGLSLGHAFQPQQSFSGEMDSLILAVGKDVTLAKN